MTAFIARQVLSVLLTIWFAVTLTFFVLRILPGDAISGQLAQAGATPAEISERRAELGLDQPLFGQYIDYLTNLTQGEMGNSLSSGLPVSLLIRQQFMPSFTLAGITMLVAMIAGFLLGIGASEDSLLVSKICQFIVTLSVSTPVYWTGTLLLVIFAVKLRWFPISGDGGLASLVLPVSLLSFHISGAIARIVQVNISEIKHSTYVLVAHSKGLAPHSILYRHVLRVALLPVIGIVALQYGFLLSGTVITETLFSRPGLGSLLLSATRDQDYPLVQGMVVLSATIYIIINLCAEILQKLADPRL